MRLPRVLPIIACCVLGVLAAACFGGGSGDGAGKAPDSSKIPTATLPAELPQVRILGESIVSTGGRRTYTIRSGDTFSAVAERLGITLEELVAANPGVDAGLLQDGDVINLPETVGNPPAATTPAPTEAANTPEAEEPAVEDTPVPEEPLPTDTPVPPAPTEAPPPAEATPTAQSLGRTYTVEAGDSMASIAARFGYTVETLIGANPGVDPNNLVPGQTIFLP
ncbi:MAG: LysM peptidoglycan-binding domain-containing protein [Chloroflexi bacterium]|nr:LysM peptidoglycan-binding domain-containing protein [Chloroflexota bacterium]